MTYNVPACDMVKEPVLPIWKIDSVQSADGATAPASQGMDNSELLLTEESKVRLDGVEEEDEEDEDTLDRLLQELRLDRLDDCVLPLDFVEPVE